MWLVVMWLVIMWLVVMKCSYGRFSAAFRRPRSQVGARSSRTVTVFSRPFSRPVSAPFSQPVRTTSPGRRTPVTIRCMLASLRSTLRSSASTARRWAGAGINWVGINRAGYLRKWLTRGIAIGIIAGVGAVVFYLALDYAGRFLLGYLADYQIPQPKGDGGNPGSHGYPRPWAIPLVTFGGALVSALIVAKFAPEAEGHGTDSAIEAVQTDPRAIRGRTIAVKTIASALTIGSGGSAGREGPAAQISAGFGSLLTRPLHLSHEGRPASASLCSCAGIGAIFGAPLGGAVLAASIVYREDFDYRSLVPGFITSATAYAVYGSILGFNTILGVRAVGLHSLQT